MKDFSIDKLLNQNLWVECNKTKYCLLMHICEIQKTGTDELIYKAENRDIDVENKHMDTRG